MSKEEFDINQSPTTGRIKVNKKGIKGLANKHSKPLAFIFFILAFIVAGGVYFTMASASSEDKNSVKSLKEKYFDSAKPPAFVLAGDIYDKAKKDMGESKSVDSKAEDQKGNVDSKREETEEYNNVKSSSNQRYTGGYSYAPPPPPNPVVAYKNQMFENAINMLAKTNYRDGGSNTAKEEAKPKKKHPGNIMLTAGSVIPCVLQTGINSDLKGMIVGRVTRDVYDTATGDFKLIPAGAKVIGSYEDAVVLGQKRLLMMWKRIILPQGKGSIDLEAMAAHDTEGYAGIGGIVDNHYAEKFGGALLLSFISSGYQLSQPVNSNTPNAGDVLSQEIGKEFHQVSSEMIRQGMQIKPTITVAPASEFIILVNQDLGLKEWTW